jgi:hypothetical protein
MEGEMMKKLLAIDPGASGGFAWLDSDGVVRAEKIPEGMTAMVDRLRELVTVLPGLAAVVEKVGLWMPGDHPNAATKFARGCGQIEAALYALGIPFEDVAPGVWMKCLGGLPKDKPERKRMIRELMARRYPHLRVTLDTADALGMLTWKLGIAGKDGGLADGMR